MDNIEIRENIFKHFYLKNMKKIAKKEINNDVDIKTSKKATIFSSIAGVLAMGVCGATMPFALSIAGLPLLITSCVFSGTAGLLGAVSSILSIVNSFKRRTLKELSFPKQLSLIEQSNKTIKKTKKEYKEALKLAKKQLSKKDFKELKNILNNKAMQAATTNYNTEIKGEPIALTETKSDASEAKIKADELLKKFTRKGRKLTPEMVEHIKKVKGESISKGEEEKIYNNSMEHPMEMRSDTIVETPEVSEFEIKKHSTEHSIKERVR